MPIMLQSINGLNNGSSRLRRLVDPKFTHLVELIHEGQLAGAIQIRIEPSKSGAESSVLVFGPSKDPELAAKGREIKSLLGVRPDLRELKVNYGGYSERDDEIDMMTRSILQIMLEFAAVVQVPQSDVEQGKALPGLIDTRAPAAPGGPPLQVLVTDAQPKDAFVAVQYPIGDRVRGGSVDSCGWISITKDPEETTMSDTKFVIVTSGLLMLSSSTSFGR
jgi:hypothetical protein